MRIGSFRGVMGIALAFVLLGSACADTDAGQGASDCDRCEQLTSTLGSHCELVERAWCQRQGECVDGFDVEECSTTAYANCVGDGDSESAVYSTLEDNETCVIELTATRCHMFDGRPRLSPLECFASNEPPSTLGSHCELVEGAWCQRQGECVDGFDVEECSTTAYANCVGDGDPESAFETTSTRDSGCLEDIKSTMCHMFDDRPRLLALDCYADF